MRRLLMITAMFLVAGLMAVPAALAQEDDVTVQEGPPLTDNPTATATPSATLQDDVITTTTTPTASLGPGCHTRPAGGGENVTVCIDTPAPTATASPTPPATVTPTPTATVAAKAQYDGGGTKEVVVGGGGRTLPETGGVSGIALLAGALLIGGGVMGLALFRRS